MDRNWKPFAGLGTVSEPKSDHKSHHSVFLKARLKLTALYVLIIAVIIFGFSIFLYGTIARNLHQASDDDFNDIQSHQHFAQYTLNLVQNELMLADTFILAVAAGLSFIMAGKTLNPIQMSLESQRAFAANASHELRTPLAVMRNDIEVYMRNNSPEKELAKNTMKSNLEEISRMSNIVEDLLLLARSDNQVFSKFENVDINVVAKDIVARMKSISENKNIKLSYTASGSSTVRGIHDQLSRVILNIIQNSIEHTPAGGSIDVSLHKENTKIVLNIKDTGSGISAENLPYIFKRFYKGDSNAGTGLGLSIVKEIVDKHKGEVTIKSEEGKGTTVAIIFRAA